MDQEPFVSMDMDFYSSHYGPHCGTVSSLLGYIELICNAVFRLF